MNPEFLKNLAPRKIILWGGRQLGLSIYGSLRRLGIAPAAFMDSSTDLQRVSLMELSVLNPTDVLAEGPGHAFIILCSSVFQKEMAGQCQAAGFQQNRDFMAATDLQKSSWFVDVAGSCNLKCLSCPRGNWPRQPQPGFMSPEKYAAVLDKIMTEDPFTGVINLYSWGEPLLSPHLADIVSITQGRGMDAAISSNLSFHKDFEDIIQAKPAYFRVSASGWGENYEKTHAGGDWNLFMDNLHKLKQHWHIHHPAMQVEMNFHIYKDRADDYARMKDFCQQMGFIFRAGHGMLNPLDNVSRLMEGEELSPQARQSIALQAFPIEKGFARLRQMEGRPCPFESIMDISWNGRVNHCQAWFDPEIEPLADDFLAAPLDDLLSRRQKSDFCQNCRTRLLHYWCGVYGDESLTMASVSEGRQ